MYVCMYTYVYPYMHPCVWGYVQTMFLLCVCYLILFGRFYTSPLLLFKLLKIQTMACGTIQPNRKNFPNLTEANLDRGEYDWLMCRDTG